METRVPSKSWNAVKAHAIVVLITATGLLSDNPVVPLLLGGLLVAPTLIALGILEARKTPLRINPLSFLFFWNTINLGIAAVYMGWRINSGEWLDFSVALISPADLAKGYVIYLLGILSMHVGMQYMRPLQQSPAAKWEANFKPLPFVWLVAIWGLGLVYLLKWGWFSFLGSLGQPLHWAALAAVTIFALLPRWYFGISKPMFGPLLAIGILGLLVANLATGSKGYIMFSFLPIVWMVVVPGVVIGMLGIGLGYGLMWRMAGENPVYEPLHMILYVSVVIGGMIDMPEAVTVYAGILSQMILFGVLFHVLRVGRRNFLRD
jgi:hypothetical protein